MTSKVVCWLMKWFALILQVICSDSFGNLINIISTDFWVKPECSMRIILNKRVFLIEKFPNSNSFFFFFSFNFCILRSSKSFYTSKNVFSIMQVAAVMEIFLPELLLPELVPLLLLFPPLLLPLRPLLPLRLLPLMPPLLPPLLTVLTVRWLLCQLAFSVVIIVGVLSG